MKDAAISEVSAELGADWILEQCEYLIRELKTVLRNKPTADEKTIAEDMLSFYQSFGSVDSAYRGENLTGEILPGFIPVREAISNSSHAKRSN